MAVSENGVRAGRYLSLALGDEVFAIAIEAVREILDDRETTRIPWMKPWMRGVINVRGTAIPVMDLAAALGLGAVRHGLDTRIVILEFRHEDRISRLGGLADSVENVVSLAPEATHRQGLGEHAGIGACLQGIARLEDGFVQVLDVAQLFSLAKGTDPIADLAAASGSPVAPAAGKGL